MPVFANTPEALLGRSDSKNPSTTCKGITSNGRPCRRPLAAADEAPANARLKPSSIRADDPSDESLYCWQHKDQASASAKSSPGPRMSHTPIPEERTSFDTLAERLGLVDSHSERRRKPKKAIASGKQQGRPTKATGQKPKKEATFCCCFRIAVDEPLPPPRPKPHAVQPTVSTPPRPSGRKYPTPSPSPSRPARQSYATPSPGRGSRRNSEASQAEQFMSLIPQDTPPQTASQLLAELAKPVSQQDEPGYIYIFWLTPESQPSTPPAEAARSRLAPPTTPSRAPGNARWPRNVLADFARAMTAADDEGEDNDTATARGGDPDDSSPPAKAKKTILLKIGRATNVQRRLNEWQRQCGYDLSLIRYYPYVPSSAAAAAASSPGGAGPRKMPHSHKVERLVHIELAGRGLRVADREKCEACGREHREWFKVEATRKAVADVDEVVRRWSDWNEAQA